MIKRRRILIVVFLSIISSLPGTIFASDGNNFMDMQISNIIEGDSQTSILTTGAKILFTSTSTMHFYQRLPVERKLSTVRFEHFANQFTLKERKEGYCLLTNENATIRIHADSLIIFRFKKNVSIRIKGLFRPSYHGEKDGKQIFIDDLGGFGIYPVIEKEIVNPIFEKPDWDMTYTFNADEEFWLSIFPPRSYNWDKSFMSIAHEGGNGYQLAYPSNELIRSAARFCNILAVHAYVWKDDREKIHTSKSKWDKNKKPWLASKHVPYDMEEFLRVRDQAHQNGMKFVVYLSPFYSKAPDILSEIKRILAEYQVDGFYFDGISTDFRKSYEIIRKTRKIIGKDRILYVHSSFDPFRSGLIYCPFIDTYADFILRGEGGRFGLELDDFLRWTVSGYNISNTVGYWWSDKNQPF